MLKLIPHPGIPVRSKDVKDEGHRLKKSRASAWNSIGKLFLIFSKINELDTNNVQLYY
jgi:hypothetical protein